MPLNAKWRSAATLQPDAQAAMGLCGAFEGIRKRLAEAQGHLIGLLRI